MRVLVVTNMWPTAEDPTFGIFVQEQVAAVRALGWDVDVFDFDGRQRRAAYAQAVAALRTRLRTGSYALVHAHYVLAGLVAWLAGAGAAGRPLVVTHHGIEVFEGWQAPLARFLTGRARRTLVISAAMAAALGLGPDAVVPCGVDLARFRPGDRAAARQALGLPMDRPLVAWVGADRPEKRLDLARAVIRRLNERGVPAELTVVSGRPHAEVPVYLAACDALLVTSTREGGPLVVKEALACDRAVVSTDVGDVRLVVAGVAGCAVVGGSTGDLAGALADALGAAIAHGPVQGRPAVAAYDATVIARRVAREYAALLGLGEAFEPPRSRPARRAGAGTHDT